jgi:hypothetical protein
VDAAVGLEDEEPRRLEELGLDRREEVVGVDDGLALGELGLRAVKVVVDEEALEELGDGVGVLVRLLGVVGVGGVSGCWLGRGR